MGSMEAAARQVLEGETSEDPLLRTLAHTIKTYPRLLRPVEEYLSTAEAELHCTGFLDEADYQAYVDSYSLPAFMLIAVLLGPDGDDRPYRAACRTFIDGSQRLDFVNDIAEDLREGRLGIPVKTLEDFSVSPEDLAAGRDTPAVRDLLHHQVNEARTALQTAKTLPPLTPAPYRALVRAIVELELLTAEAASARGAGLLRGSATPPLMSTLRLLLGARRKARRVSCRCERKARHACGQAVPRVPRRVEWL